MRMSRTLFTALLVACDGDGSRVAPGTTPFAWPPTSTGTDCVDTGDCEPSPWFEVVYLTWSAQFGLDRDGQRLGAVNTPYGPVEPSIDLLLGTRRWSRSGFDSGDTTEYCLVSMPLRDATPPSWIVGDPSLWYGVAYAGDAPLSTCDTPGYELDPEQWTADPLGAIARYESGEVGWSAAVGELSENAARIVASAFRPEDLPYVFGGAMTVPLLSGTDRDVYALAYHVDALGAVSIGPDGSLDAFLAEDVRASREAVPSAWYNVVALYIYMLSP